MKARKIVVDDFRRRHSNHSSDSGRHKELSQLLNILPTIVPIGHVWKMVSLVCYRAKHPLTV